MNMVGMGVTIVLILAVGGVGVWYWLRIKETASHEKVEDKTPPRIPQEPIFGEDLINSGDIKVDEIKTSPPVEEPQPESQSPLQAEETVEEVREILPEEPEEEEEPVETSPMLEEIDDSGLPKYDPFVTELVRITFKKPVTGSQLAPFVKTAMENARGGCCAFWLSKQTATAGLCRMPSVCSRQLPSIFSWLREKLLSTRFLCRICTSWFSCVWK